MNWLIWGGVKNAPSGERVGQPRFLPTANREIFLRLSNRHLGVSTRHSPNGGRFVRDRHPLEDRLTALGTVASGSGTTAGTTALDFTGGSTARILKALDLRE
jgi:hypothetical protein